MAMTTAHTSQNDHAGGQDPRRAPNERTMRPTAIVAMATKPTRRAHTAVLQCPLCCNVAGSSMPRTVEGAPAAHKSSGPP